MKKYQSKSIRIITACVILILWFCWDFTQAKKNIETPYKSYKVNPSYDLISQAKTKVSIVRSNDSLKHPVPVDDATIGYQTIEEMVRKALELAGGVSGLIHSGDMVLLKPNIVTSEVQGSGEVTDVRVVKALVKIIDEIDPGNIEIVIGEASPIETAEELPYGRGRTEPRWKKLWDVSGYQDLLTDPYLKGINFRLSNLNGSPPENPWQDLVLVDVPGGGEALPQGGKYWLHKDVVNADVFITVPVMKVHTPGITVALKNQIGIAPSTKYGFYKVFGVPQDDHAYKLTHLNRRPEYWTEKEIVDLCMLAHIKFAVVDAIACLETGKTARREGNVITNLVRMNTIIAGEDPVAVDHVCTRLMGMNPDDIEHITLAEKVGLGTNNPDNIEIKGADLEQTMVKFKKSYAKEGRYGQGNRVWLLKGPYNASDISDPINHEFIANEANIRARANVDGWSSEIYFIDDRINLMDYYNLDSDEVVSYAFSYFDAPSEQEAELWVGSDEALKIYINGQQVYSYSDTRDFADDELLSEKVKINVNKGENRLLVKSYQKFNRYDFSLNICDPEDDPNFDGNRIWGLKFMTNPM